MLKDCKFKSVERCGELPDTGVEKVVGCVVCFLRSDRAHVAEQIARQELALKAWRESQAKRLERLKLEFSGKS